MPAYLSVDSIRNAADLINTTLISKGYITERLKFPTIDWEELTSDQPGQKELANLTVQENIYNNDKNLINIVHSLCQALDRHSSQHDASNKTLARKQRTIDELQKQVEVAEAKAEALERQLDRAVQIERAALLDQVKSLAKTNQSQSQELTKMKSWSADLQTKHEVETRRLSLEISDLKDRLLHTRHLSTTISYGKPLPGNTRNGVDKQDQLRVNPALIHGNKPSVDNRTVRELTPEDSALAPLINDEYEGIATQLSELVESLIKENSKFAKFMVELNDYIEQLNARVLPEKIKDGTLNQLPAPSNTIDMRRIASDASADIIPFESVSAPLLASVYDNYECISVLIEMCLTSLGAGAASNEAESRKTIDQLTQENKVLYKNWQDAMTALEDWRNYKQQK